MNDACLRYIRDWLHLRPLIAPYKIARRWSIGRAYPFKPAPDARALNEIRWNLGTRPLVITVAYNSAWMLRWHIAFSELNFCNVDHLIADNSPDAVAARQVEALCQDVAAYYLKLPFNRFSLGRPKNASLSHACALNWVWRNVVKHVRPPLVAVLDHDLIPLRPVDFSSKVSKQPFYGVKVLGAHHGWQIWPGYAIFDRSLIDDYHLDFWVDMRAGLDTGGANWRRVYRYFNAEDLQFALAQTPESGRFALKSRRFDEWWHVGGASEYSPKADDWRREVETTLQREYDVMMEI